MLHKQAVNLFLRRAPLSAAFSHVNELGALRKQAKNLPADQFVMKYDICRAQNPRRFYRQQLGIARPGANQKRFARSAQWLLPRSAAFL
jgi:hypothetical protein